MIRIITFLMIILFLACKGESSITDTSMADDVNFLADDALQGRATGTDGERKAADYIAERLKEMDIDAKGTVKYFQDFNFTPKTHPHDSIKFNTNSDGSITGRNVIGYINNDAPSTVVIGAHYDHLGLGGDGSLYRDSIAAVHNGADDNASGVAVLLDLARKLKQGNTNNNYLFIAFSGEEMGLIGSNYFTKNPTIDLKQINYMINMDMVGRLKADNTLAVYGTGTSPMFKQTLKVNNERFKLVQKESGIGPSDHTSFYNSDIPVLHFFTGQHEDYHKPSDDSEKLNYQGMETISSYIFNVISDLNDNGKLVFRKTKNESEVVPRFKVGLGVIPDYLFDGVGMRIDGISEGKPAQKAGLQKGDIVIQIGDLEIKNMMDYMKALSTFEKGNTTKVIVDRNNKEVIAEITF